MPRASQSTANLNVVTIDNGEHALVDANLDGSVEELRRLIYATGLRGGMRYPEPEKQRVVFKGREIKSCTLREAGLTNESTVVVVERRVVDSGARAIHEKSPSKEYIEDMIRRLAASKGTGLDGGAAPAPSGRDRAGFASINDIQQLLNAITNVGHYTASRNSMWLNANLGASSGDVAGGSGADSRTEDDDVDSLSREDSEAASDANEGEGPSGEAPEPHRERLQQLVDMGFSEAIASKALILRHNNMYAAMDWILEHGDDPDAEAPLTEAQLQRIAHHRRRVRRSRRRFRSQAPQGGFSAVAPGAAIPVDPRLVDQLVAMGFSERRARFALQTFSNNVELACQWLLASADDLESGEDEEDGAVWPTEGGAEGGPRLGEGQEQGGGEIAEGTEGGMGEMPRSVGSGLSLPGNFRRLLMSPNVQEGLQSERLMQAFQAMMENPREARSYLTDPEIGPILLQIQRVQRVSTGAASAEPEPAPAPAPVPASGMEVGAGAGLRGGLGLRLGAGLGHETETDTDGQGQGGSTDGGEDASSE